LGIARASQHFQTFDHWNEDMLTYLTEHFIPRLSKEIRIFDAFKQSNAGYFASDFKDTWDSLDETIADLREHLASLVALKEKLMDNNRHVVSLISCRLAIGHARTS
jgi:hypothetical protein